MFLVECPCARCRKAGGDVDAVNPHTGQAVTSERECPADVSLKATNTLIFSWTVSL